MSDSTKEQEPFKPKFWPAKEEYAPWKKTGLDDLEDDVDDSYFYERPKSKE